MSTYRLYQPIGDDHATLLGTIKADPATKDRMESAGLLLVDAADPELR